MTIRIPGWVNSVLDAVHCHAAILTVTACLTAAVPATIWHVGSLGAFLLGLGLGVAGTALVAHRIRQRDRVVVNASEFARGQLQRRLDGNTAAASAQDAILTRAYPSIHDPGKGFWGHGGDAA